MSRETSQSLDDCFSRTKYTPLKNQTRRRTHINICICSSQSLEHDTCTEAWLSWQQRVLWQYLSPRFTHLGGAADAVWEQDPSNIPAVKETTGVRGGGAAHVLHAGVLEPLIMLPRGDVDSFVYIRAISDWQIAFFHTLPVMALKCLTYPL